SQSRRVDQRDGSRHRAELHVGPRGARDSRVLRSHAKIVTMHRIAIVASHVIQYQDPFFRLLAADPEIALTVLYCSSFGATSYRDEDMKTSLSWDIDLLQGYRYRFLPNWSRN